MKIAIFTDTFLPDINGVATSVSILREELIAHGHDVMIVTTVLPKDSDYVDRIPVIRINGLDLKHLYGYRMAPIYSSHAMKDITAFAPDVIHVQTEFGIGVFARIVGRHLHVPVVYTYHTMWEDYSHYLSGGVKPLDFVARRFIKRLSHMYGGHCQELIVPSDKAAARLYSYGIDKHINVVETGLRLGRFQKTSALEKSVQAIKTQYHLQGKFVILFLGRIAQEKSIDFLIRAMKKIMPIRRNAVLMIVGGGPDERALQDLTHELGLEADVIFTGAKESADVPAYYQAADVFVSASMTETQGLTYIEAMASGLPVFARYDDNLKDVIKDGVNGFFFHDENEYVAKLMKLDNIQKERIAKQAMADAKAHSSTIFYEKIIEVYKKALNDMQEHYKIQNIEKQKDQSYLLTIAAQKHKEKLRVSPRLIGAYGLLSGMFIDEETYQALKADSQLHEVYQAALKLLMYRDYAQGALLKRLIDKGYEEETASKVVHLLAEKGLIDDYNYAHEVIAKTLRHQGGFEKARRALKKEGVEAQTIEDALSEFDQQEALNGAKAYAMKLVHQNRHRSQKALEMNIRQKLHSHGYSNDIIEEVMATSDFSMDEARSDALLDQAFDKAYQRLSRKYNGQELTYKLKHVLIQKGFTYEAINNKLEERGSELDGED